MTVGGRSATDARWRQAEAAVRAARDQLLLADEITRCDIQIGEAKDLDDAVSAVVAVDPGA